SAAPVRPLRIELTSSASPGDLMEDSARYAHRTFHLISGRGARWKFGCSMRSEVSDAGAGVPQMVDWRRAGPTRPNDTARPDDPARHTARRRPYAPAGPTRPRDAPTTASAAASA